MILPSLLVQKSSKSSKSKENNEHLERRICLWKQKNLVALVDEVKAIQNRLTNSNAKPRTEDIRKKFSELMQHGKVNQALKLLSKEA